MSYHQNHGQSTYRKFRGTYKVFCCSNTLSRCLMALARSGFRRWSTNSSNFLTFSCRARASATAMAMGPVGFPRYSSPITEDGAVLDRCCGQAWLWFGLVFSAANTPPATHPTRLVPRRRARRVLPPVGWGNCWLWGQAEGGWAGKQ